MTSTRELTSDQKAQIYSALTLRDADFLSACYKALGRDAACCSVQFGSFYEKLARGEWCKVEVIDHLLTHFGYRNFSRHRATATRYDIDKLLTFEPEDEQRFVSMVIDLFANRSPTPAEALEFEHLLRSERANRDEIIRKVAARYPEFVSFEEGDLHLTPSRGDGQTVCRTWRGRILLHPNATVHTGSNAGDGFFATSFGPLLSCTLKMPHPGDWEVLYHLAHSGDRPLQIEVQDTQGRPILRGASWAQRLVGAQAFSLAPDSHEIHIVLSGLATNTDQPSNLEFAEIRLKPKVEA